MIERYSFEAIERKEFLTKKGDWVIYISPMPGGFQNEYAPAKDFYKIQKLYHLNGIISIKGCFLGSVPFGRREIYNEKGSLVETIDEDKKFGEIKPKDIVGIIEKVGWINRETGENIIVQSPLQTDGNCYRELENYLNIQFQNS